MEEEKEQMVPETGTCECADRETDQSLREKEASSAIDFEDALHNQVYVKRKPRRKRDVSDILFRKTKSLDQVIPISLSLSFAFLLSLSSRNCLSRVPAARDEQEGERDVRNIRGERGQHESFLRDERSPPLRRVQHRGAGVQGPGDERHLQEMLDQEHEDVSHAAVGERRQHSPEYLQDEHIRREQQSHHGHASMGRATAAQRSDHHLSDRVQEGRHTERESSLSLSRSLCLNRLG